MTIYNLASPIPDKVNLGTTEQGLDTTGVNCLWIDASGGATNGEIHVVLTFGSVIYYGIHINLTTGTSHYLESPTLGGTWHYAYNKDNNKLYVATQYVYGGLDEIDPATGTITNRHTFTAVHYCQHLSIGADYKVYYLDFGSTASNVYSYDPALDVWFDYGAISNIRSVGAEYGSVVSDGSYVYAAIFANSNGPCTLMICPVGTQSWTEWTVDGDANTNISLSFWKEAGTGTLVLYRKKADTSVVWYSLAAGGWTLLGSEPTVDNPQSAKPYHYCVVKSNDQMDISSEEGFQFYYNFDLSALCPVKDVWEKTRVKYKLAADSIWTTVQYDFTGDWQWVPLWICTPFSGKRACIMGVGYMAGALFNTDTQVTTYLGAQILSPYDAKRHSNGKIYFSGYSNKLLEWVPSSNSNDWTLTPANASPYAYDDPTRPNPFVVDISGLDPLQYRYIMDIDANGVIWVGCIDTRTSNDYGDVIWYDPANGTYGNVYSWGNPSYIQFRHLCVCLGGTKVLVSNDQGEIRRINAATKADEPGVALTGSGNHYFCDVGSDAVVVINSTGPTIGLLKPSDMTYTISPQSLVDNNSDPVVGNLFGYGEGASGRRVYFKFAKGPDNWPWMFVGTNLYRINPADLSFNLVKACGLWGKITFNDNYRDLLIYAVNGATFPGQDCNMYILSGVYTVFDTYSMGSYVSLPGTDADLSTTYTFEQITDVATDDTDMVPQSATSQKAIHQFKQEILGAGGIINVVAQVTIPCSTSTTYLQIYNRSGTPAWDTIDSDNATGANTDFTLSATVVDLTDYKDENNIVACRVYQEMQ